MNKGLENFAVCERTPSDSSRVELEHATFGQRLLWSLDRLRGASGALNCPACCWIDGPLDLARLYVAIGRLMATHAALRATIVPGRTLRQAFSAACKPQIRLIDLTHSGHDLQILLRDELASRIDPARSATRITLLKLSRESHVLVINVHHLFTDLWSSNVLLEDLASTLQSSALAAIDRDSGWDFITYSRWERQCAHAGGFARQQRYWFERLAGMHPISVPLSPTRADARGSRSLIEANIDESIRVRLEAMARSRQASSFAALLAVLFAMTWRNTGERDLAVASLFANRSRPELKRTVGFLVNMVMLRVRVGQVVSFADFIDQSQRASAGALANGDLPYHALSPSPLVAPNRGRADDFVFHATPDPIDNSHDAGDLRIRCFVPEVVGRFDAELAVRPAGSGLVVRLTYNEGRLSDSIARNILDEYVSTAHLVTMSPPDAALDRIGE